MPPPRWLFYAGKGPEWSNLIFRRIVNEHLGSANTIGFIDWHTGLGSFGEILYLIFDEQGSPEHVAAARWWSPGAIDAGITRKRSLPALLFLARISVTPQGTPLWPVCS